MRLDFGPPQATGRFVLWKAPMADPLQIGDGTAAVSYELQAALTAAGCAVNAWAGAPDSSVWSYPDTEAALSGDGSVAFVGTNAGVVAVRDLKRRAQVSRSPDRANRH